jgi:hypothetical protein
MLPGQQAERGIHAATGASHTGLKAALLPRVTGASHFFKERLEHLPDVGRDDAVALGCGMNAVGEI